MLTVTIKIKDGCVVLDGDELVIADPELQLAYTTLAHGGVHVTDEAMSREILRAQNAQDAKCDREADDFLRSKGVSVDDYAPTEAEDLLDNLAVISADGDADVFLEMVQTFAYGTLSERQELTTMLESMTYPELAQMALVAIKRVGRVEGASLLAALHETSPEVFGEMERIMRTA